MMNFDPHHVRTLAIHLKGRAVGIMHRLVGDQYLFAFEQEYMDDRNRPTLSLSFKTQAGTLMHSTRIVNLRLPPFFSNLLPEGHLRTYLAKRAHVKQEREFFLLAVLGADLPGAVTATVLDADKNFDLELSQDEANLQSSSILRFSLAGVQLKFSAIEEASGGLTIPAHGMGGSWIIKLPSTRFDHVPENEYVMLALAESIGIRVPRHRLIDLKEIRDLPKDVSSIQGRALMIERFDRSPEGAIHMEDFAQVFGLFPDKKYDYKSYANIARVLWAETTEADLYEFVRRLTFAVSIGNADLHLKNCSLLYPDGKTPRLSPAYDLVSTLPYLPNDRMALNFGGSRSLEEITNNQILRFAKTARIPPATLPEIILETLERTTDAWKKSEAKDLLPKTMQKIIATQIQTVALRTLCGIRG